MLNSGYSVKFLLFSVAMVFAGCGGRGAGSSHTDTSKVQQPATPDNTQYDRKFNDYAVYMSGQELPADNVLGKEDSLEFYKQHCAQFSKRWKEMDDNRLSKMRSWAKDELWKHIDNSKNLYYPFSGADFLHAYQFFPNAKKSLYIANETVGDIPDIKSMTAKQRVVFLKQIEQVLGDIFKRSYFITGRMKGQIPALKGMIPVYMVFLSRCNMEVLNVELIDLTADHKTVVRKGPATGVEGVRFTYCPKGNRADIRTLEYFNCDASNAGTKAKPQVVAYVKAFGNANVFFKAASYLMHNPGFSEFREACLSIADAVVQDDTGIPYKFVKDQYNVYLYGKYVRPISDFGSDGYQADLAALYKDSSKVKSLPFSLGYHWFDKQQNYMCFVKKK